MKYASVLLNKFSLLLFLAISTMLVSGSLVGNAFAAPQQNGQPFQALDSRITAIEQDNTRSDSFFDVFFDVFTVDSFFDIFTDLQTTNDAQQAQIDSFFDVFTEISVHDADVARIDTEILALDLRGESCNVGMVVTGINADGNLECSPDATGSGGGSSGQLIVVERSGPTIEFSADRPFKSSFALCLPGEMVVGGGYRASPATVNVSSESLQFGAGGIPGWFVSAFHESGAGSITALAECARIAP